MQLSFYFCNSKPVRVHFCQPTPRKSHFLDSYLSSESVISKFCWGAAFFHTHVWQRPKFILTSARAEPRWNTRRRNTQKKALFTGPVSGDRKSCFYFAPFTSTFKDQSRARACHTQKWHRFTTFYMGDHPRLTFCVIKMHPTVFVGWKHLKSKIIHHLKAFIWYQRVNLLLKPKFLIPGQCFSIYCATIR